MPDGVPCDVPDGVPDGVTGVRDGVPGMPDGVLEDGLIERYRVGWTDGGMNRPRPC